MTIFIDDGEAWPTDMFEGIDDQALTEAIEADKANSGKTSWERLTTQGQESMRRYCSTEIVEQMQTNTPS